MMSDRLNVASDGKLCVDFSRNIWFLLGLPFDIVDLSEAIIKTSSFLECKQRCFLTTPNLNFLITAQSDQVFFQSVVDSDLIVADGMPIIWAAKLLGVPLTERVAGSDLFERLSNQSSRERKISVFFFGGQKGIAEQACQKLYEASAGMTCCGFYDPGFVSIDEMSTPTIIDTINDANPDFLVVALGAGKGQEWIQKNRHHLKVSVISHLGAVINFVAGHVERAPLFWQRCGLEWLWRIKQEPNLWRRYFFDGLAFVKLVLLKVFPLVFYDRWLKFSGVLKSSISIRHEIEYSYMINLCGSAYYAQLDIVKHGFADAIRDKKHDVVLNCTNLIYIDAAFIGSLMLFQRYLNEQGRQLYLQNTSKRIYRLLDLNNVLNRFQFKKINSSVVLKRVVN